MFSKVSRQTTSCIPILLLAQLPSTLAFPLLAYINVTEDKGKLHLGFWQLGSTSCFKDHRLGFSYNSKGVQHATNTLLGKVTAPNCSVL